MENATKALLIAAAVLVVILIISLGIGVFNLASEQMSGIDLSEYQIQQHNDKFKNYVGTNVSGTEVNTMLSTVFNHNNAQETTETCVQVVDSTGTTDTTSIAASNTLSTSPTKVSPNRRYTVKCEYSTTTKLINKITID